MSGRWSGDLGVTSRIGLLAFPRRFREQHASDLMDLYRDLEPGRRSGRLAMLWDLLRNGVGARLDDMRPQGGLPAPKSPQKRSNHLDSLWQDIRFALRMLRKSPAFTAVAAASLAVGIGANTAIFSVVDAALLRPLAVASPEELVVLGWRSRAGTEMPDVSTWGWYLRDDNGDGLSSSYSVSAYETIRDRNDVLTATFAFADIGRLNVNADNRAELALGQVVSGNYFAALGLQPVLGRLIVEDDDRPDADAVVVLSHGYWQRRFGADAGVLGATVLINDASFTVIGVTPADFRGTLQAGDNPEITMPLAQQPLVATSTRDMSLPEMWWLHLMGRLRPGTTMEAAEQSLSSLFHQSVASDLFAGDVPEQYTLPDVDLRAGFQGMTEQRSLIRKPLQIMTVVVGLVLLIACINVANLLMARSGTRVREIAVRLSMGASRARLVRQLLAESVVLATLAGSAGVVLAGWGREAFLGSVVARDLYIEGVRTDARVLGFGLAVSLATGVVFGLAPAFRASRPDLTPALKETPGDVSRRQGRWGVRSLLIVQVAMSVVLLVTAGLFVCTLAKLQQEATGFDPAGVAILRLDPGLNGYDGIRQVALYNDLQSRLKAIPGVQSATVAHHSPVSGRISMTTLQVLGYEPVEDESMRVFYNVVAPEFFATFRIPLLRGRGIEDGDREGAPMVAVVNETFAERFFPGADPIGRRLGLGRDADAGEYEIVGVAADVKYQQLRDQQYPVAHVSLAQHGQALTPMTLALRTSADASEAIAAAREVVRQVDANIPLFETRTLSAQQAETLQMERLFVRMSVVLGGLALGLACIGLYGILSYAVVRRTREIGVRMALGADGGDVVCLVMSELRAVMLGAILGLGIAFGVTRYLDSLLYGLSPTDPTVFAAATALLLAIAVFAAYLPARRASNVDPLVALRFD